MVPHLFSVKWMKSAVWMTAHEGRSEGSDERAASPSVLIVEDEILNAWHLASVFRSQGFNVIGPAGSIEAAQALIEEELPDAAVLDVNIRGRSVFPVARSLAEKGVPIVFATAHAREDALWPDDLAGHPRVQKPFLEDRLVRIVTGLLTDEA